MKATIHHELRNVFKHPLTVNVRSVELNEARGNRDGTGDIKCNSFQFFNPRTYIVYNSLSCSLNGRRRDLNRGQLPPAALVGVGGWTIQLEIACSKGHRLGGRW